MLIDNKQIRLIDALKSNLHAGDTVSIISSYWTIFAFAALKKELLKVDRLRLIFPHSYSQSNRIHLLSGDKHEVSFRNQLLQQSIARELIEWVKNKAEFRELQGNEHGLPRCIHIAKKTRESIAIQGNLNFSSASLGLTYSKNMDLNILFRDPQTTKALLEGFDQAWKDDSNLTDVKNTVCSKLDKIAQDNTPQSIYFYTLHHLFKNNIADIENSEKDLDQSGFYQSVVWNSLYDFQKDGVRGVIEKLEKYQGCILADSVGLGKTFEALAVIKYYELRKYRVLVLAPKKLHDNWSTYRNNVKENILEKDLFAFDVLNHTDLTRTSGYSDDLKSIDLGKIRWDNYDLVVIDESHNFRNSSDAKDGKITRYSRLMNDVIKSGKSTKVLMLSATPVNNKLNDLKNQIAFISKGDEAAFSSAGIPNYATTIAKAQKQFTEWLTKNAANRNTQELTGHLRMDYFRLLDMLTIARSRNHIKKYYSLKGIGQFPNRRTPISIRSRIDAISEFPGIKELDRTIRKLTLAPYSPLSYVMPSKRDDYDRKYDMELRGNAKFRQVDRENSLVHLMRVNLLKRLESSIHSFRETITTLLAKTESVIRRIDSHYSEPLNTPTIDEIDIDSDEYSQVLLGSKNVKVRPEDCDLIKWKHDLEQDKHKLQELLEKSQAITASRDQKLLELKQFISNKLQAPLNDGNRKILIFTAFADTAQYLYEQIAPWGHKEYQIHSALVTGGAKNQCTLRLKDLSLGSILANFSPKSKKRESTQDASAWDIEILIATDCISEGQNLQDCDTVINYDIHWNPVRLIQRFGRIDRIGSTNQWIQMVNFWPDIELDEYIDLEARVSGRMVLLDVSATGEENLIDNQNTAGSMNDLEYRKKQLQLLQTKIVDLEDMSGGLSITDLTLNDFRMDLANYLQGKPSSLLNGVPGSFAIINRPKELQEEIPAGVLFCLRQIESKDSRTTQQPLTPYSLVFVEQQTGNIRYGSMEARKSLDLFRVLCKEADSLDSESLEWFQQLTKQGSDMNIFTQLLGKTIESIQGQEDDVGLDRLFDPQCETLGIRNSLSNDELECISWLVVR